MRYLLDTNIIIAAMKGLPAIRTRLGQIPVSDLVLSPIVLGELQLGVEKSQQQARNAARLARLIAGMPLAPLDHRVSRHYGLIRSRLERSGTPIGGNDYWIAAQALCLGAVLVTDNLAEFSRIEGLALENWLRSAESDAFSENLT